MKNVIKTNQAHLLFFTNTKYTTNTHKVDKKYTSPTALHLRSPAYYKPAYYIAQVPKKNDTKTVLRRSVRAIA